MPKRSSRKPKGEDPNVRAFRVVQEATEQEEPAAAKDDVKDPLAVELGRRGGLKGGKARAKKLTAEERSAIARKAAIKRWSANKRHS